MKTYSVKQLAQLAGVSVRTLHVYDRMCLLKPTLRTEARYRQYGEAELLRLQQILFYKELDFPLKEIRRILDDRYFDLSKALESHKAALKIKQERLGVLLDTIDKTMHHLKFKNMENFEELFEGMPREQALAYRKEAIDKWGEEVVVLSEKSLLQMPKQTLEQLKADQKDIAYQLGLLVNEDPTSKLVQSQIRRHYTNICGFWGAASITAEQYKGLADLYVTDERYTARDGKPNPAYAAFVRMAMEAFAEANLV